MRLAQHDARHDAHVEKRTTMHRLRINMAMWLPVAALFAVLGSGCGHEAKEKDKSKGESNAMEVTTTTPKRQLLRRYILQPGVVASYEETPIYTKLSGFLETVNVDIGDRVKKDELLGELWVPEVKEDVAVKLNRTKQGEADVLQARETLKAARANIETWTAKVEEAKASVKVAKADFARWSAEYITESGLRKDEKKPGSGVISTVRVEEVEHQRKATESAWKEAEAKQKSAEAFLAESKARCNQASADVEVAKANLAVWKAEWEEEVAWFGYSRITAPFDGIVTQRNVHTGHFLQPANSGTTSKMAEPLFVVMRTDIMRVVVQVPEYDAPLIRDGADAVVRLQAYRGHDIKCKVTRSSWSLDNETRTLRTEIFLDNTDPVHKLEPGMYANVSITADLPDTLTLPSETILTDGNKHYCFMLQDGKAKRVNVRLGIANDTTTQILKKEAAPGKRGEEGAWVDFKGDEQIISSKLKSIQNGQAVKVN